MNPLPHLVRIAATVIAMALLPSLALAQPIKLGEINSYKTLPGVPGALQEGNGTWHSTRSTPEAGCSGALACHRVAGRQRQSRGRPCASPRNSSRGKRWSCSMGTFASNVGLAVTDFAKQLQDAVPRGGAADRQDHLAERQPLHLPPARPPTYMQTAMLVPEAGEAAEEALGARLPPTTSTASRPPRRSSSC